MKAEPPTEKKEDTENGFSKGYEAEKICGSKTDNGKLVFVMKW